MVGKGARRPRSAPFILDGAEFVQTLGHVPVTEIEAGEHREVFFGPVEVLEAAGKHPGPIERPLAELDFPVGPLLVAVPFVAPVAAVLATWRAPRVATLVQMLGVALLGAVAALDVVRTPAVAIAQFVVAGCAMLVSIGSLAARPVRRSTTPSAPTFVRDLTDTGARP